MKSENKRLKVLTKPVVSRREILRWTPPALTAIALPAHAQMSTCGSQLTMTAAVPSKCSGTPPTGDAVITLNSDAADPVDPNLEVIAINVLGAAVSDTITLPVLPMTVSASSGADIQWMGNASDATTCLPVSMITFEVSYRCAGNPMSITQNFNLTTVLANAIP